MPCGWEGNRRSGVALVMRHRLHLVYSPTGSQPRQGDEHPAYAVLVQYGPFTLSITGTVYLRFVIHFAYYEHL